MLCIKHSAIDEKKDYKWLKFKSRLLCGPNLNGRDLPEDLNLQTVHSCIYFSFAFRSSLSAQDLEAVQHISLTSLCEIHLRSHCVLYQTDPQSFTLFFSETCDKNNHTFQWTWTHLIIPPGIGKKMMGCIDSVTQSSPSCSSFGSIFKAKTQIEIFHLKDYCFGHPPNSILLEITQPAARTKANGHADQGRRWRVLFCSLYVVCSC